MKERLPKNLLFYLYSDKTWYEQIDALTKIDITYNLLIQQNEEIAEKIEELKKLIEELQKEYKKTGDKKIYATLLDLIRELKELEDIKSQIEDTAKSIEKEKNSWLILKKISNAFPQIVKYGILNEEEVTAVRYLLDTYNTLFLVYIFTGDEVFLQFINAYVVPLIISIIETSLARNGYFVRLLLGSPIIPPEQGNLKPNSLEKLRRLIGSEEEEEEEYEDDE